MSLIIEQDGKAIELNPGAFSLYGIKEEFKSLSIQADKASVLVQIGWVEFDIKEKEYKVHTKLQQPEITSFSEAQDAITKAEKK